MFALEVEYLTGRAAAAAPEDRDAAEWPPHPGRLFLALVAAHAEHDPTDAAERAALLWLERQEPPALGLPDYEGRRSVPTVFVPVNDNTGPDSIPRGGFSAQVVADRIRVLPERRSKQPRSFPAVAPDPPRVVFVWERADTAGAAAHRPALERLAVRVPYLGHSSSLVRVAPCEPPAELVLRPADDGETVLRVPTPGRLDELLATHAAGRRPTAGFFAGYARAAAPEPDWPATKAFGRLFVFRLRGGPTPPLEAAPYLTGAVRDALMKHCPDQPPPEVISGHDAAGRPSRRDHLAVLPLPFVDHRHADGSVKGFAVALPAEITPADRVTVLRTLGNVEQQKITLGRQGAWTVERDSAVPDLRTLRPEPYLGPAETWATVTPLVFDRFPKRTGGRTARDLVVTACARAGLPEPAEVGIGPIAWLRGVPPSRVFVPRPGKAGQPPRPFWHVALSFDRPVRGPLILGAGRYYGMGLFRSLRGRPAGGA
jgi:CRISPR-associated protein Csb2